MTDTITFNVNLDRTYTDTAHVNYTTQNGTALAGTNYVATSGVLTFSPGTTTHTISVTIMLTDTAVNFNMVLSNPVLCIIAIGTATATIPALTVNIPKYVSRFNWIYNILKNTSNGYFGPTSGPKQYQMPYHAVETLIAEAPDWGHESVSETISFWARLEAWKIAISGDTSGYTAMWNSVENNYIPSTSNQPWGAYNPASPGTYTPEATQPSGYPTMPDPLTTVGADPLATPLQTTYSTLNVYLMHWLYDVDGVYGFHNGDSTIKAVAVNNYSRGMHEGLFQTVMHCSWDDWANGGSTYGYLPLYGKSTPTYPSAPFPYAQQWSYTCAPDAEVRLISAAWMANKTGASVSVQDAKAKKLGDYLRYCLYDKYFKAIPGYDGSGNHYLISWYTAWGGQVPSGGPGTWGYRIGSSESHFGYNGVDIAYFMATSGGGYSPSTTGAATQWQNSLARQLELIRWLQSPEGPIAGGVTNSWYGQYLTPTDGRQTAKFYGLYYTYSPVWHNPPSNNWAGYQAWGLERVANLYLTTASRIDVFSNNIRANCIVILDRFVPWLLDHSSLIGTTSFSLPTTLGWTSTTQVVGQTTTVANIDGVFEYLPSLNWDSTGNYATFWSGSAVPNPNLHCTITASGISLGVAAGFALLLLEYAQAKRTSGITLSTTIPNSSHTVMECYTLGKGILDAIWTMQDSKGFTNNETRADYTGFNSTSYIPASFSGHMPNGETLNSSTTFISSRNFITSDANWSKVQSYLSGGAAPTFTYHRFWEQCEIAAGFAMLHQYFNDLAEP